MKGMLSQNWQKTAVLIGSVSLLEIAARVYAYSKSRRTMEAIPMATNRPQIPRLAADHIRQRVAGRHHLLVCGPTGVGKTMAVKLALDNQDPIDGINHAPTTFLPFYVDLRTIIAPASHLEEAHCAPSLNDVTPKDLAARVDAAFSAAADSFEDRSLTTLRSLAWSSLAFELSRNFSWIGRAIVAAVDANQRDSAATPSIERHLRRFLDEAVMHELVISAESHLHSRRDCIPVLIVDEVHLLDDLALKKIRHEFVAFLFQHASAKSMAPVVLVLLSSDATAPRILESWGGKYKLAKLFSQEVVGDVPRNELPSFLAKLTELKLDDNRKRQHTFPGMKRWLERIEDPLLLNEAYDRYGGFANDWIRLHDAQLISDRDVVLPDKSAVSILARDDSTSVSNRLISMGLSPADVLHTFCAITESNRSPRGAVLQISLLFDRDGRSVSHGALSRMSKENLIEIREGNPDVLDYDDLAPYAQEFYVCATSPLARSSMTKVVRLLELEEAARRKSEEEARRKSWWWPSS